MSFILAKLLIYFKRLYLGISLPKFKYILSKKSNYSKYNILDIGCGGGSPKKTKIVFPFSRYVAIDRDFGYHNSRNIIELIDRKICHDLNDDIQILSEELKDEMFDIVIFNHTIEHTSKGLDVLRNIAPRIKKDGVIYIEFPSIRSLSLPNMKGTLNFCDDKTHLRLYSVQEIANVLLDENLSIIRGGRRFNIFSLFLIPFRIVSCILFKKSPAGVFWDLAGFADFVFAIKN